MKLIIVGTERYSINMCDFDLMYRNSDHEIVDVLYHGSTASKSWFKTGIYKPSCRNSIVTKLTDLKHVQWNSEKQLFNLLDQSNFDYICLGNGNCDTGLKIQERYDNILFSEYGWLPWNDCFYIDRKGVGPKSSIRHTNFQDIEINNDKFNQIKQVFNHGTTDSYLNKDFVYVPLQVDSPTSNGKPDFKFNYTRFKNNYEFLSYVIDIVPKDVTILVKKHPASRNPTPNLKSANLIDISNYNINKFKLLERMLGLICINSTSALEALLFGKRVFTFGHDIFSGNGITFENPGKEIGDMLRSKYDPTSGFKFIGLLLQRQVERSKCYNPEYIKNHYWNQQL